MNTYTIGNIVSLTTTFKDEDGNLIDPEVVSLAIRLPSLVVEDLTADVIRVSTGVYQAQFTPTLNGLHFYRFSSVSGGEPLSAPDEHSFLAQTTFPG